jgi:hypothetical protein
VSVAPLLGGRREQQAHGLVNHLAHRTQLRAHGHRHRRASGTAPAREGAVGGPIGYPPITWMGDAAARAARHAGVGSGAE